MRYKIKKKVRRVNEKVFEYYYIQKEVKRWFDKKPRWKYVYETGYAGRSRAYFYTIDKAEEFIKKMIEADNHDYRTEDIKIIETRESTIDKLLENE